MRLILTALLLLPLAAFAQVKGEDAASRTTVAAFATCTAAGGKPQSTVGYLSKVEINQDGKFDVVLDLGRLSCVGARDQPFCNADGCELRVFVSGKDGLQQVLETRARHWSATVQGSRVGLTLQQAGAACEPHAPQGCERRLVWTGQAFADAPPR